MVNSRMQKNPKKTGKDMFPVFAMQNQTPFFP